MSASCVRIAATTHTTETDQGDFDYGFWVCLKRDPRAWLSQSRSLCTPDPCLALGFVRTIGSYTPLSLPAHGCINSGW